MTIAMKRYLLILISLLIVQSLDLLVARQNTISFFESCLDTVPTVSQTIKPCLSQAEYSDSDLGGAIETYLSAKPTFVSVKVDAITPIPETRYYDLDITVVCDGGDYLYVEQSEEFSDIVDTHFYYEPDIVRLRFERIFMQGMAWVDMELVNAEGKAYYTLEIPKQTASGNFVLMQDETDLDIARIEVRDVQGRVVLRADDYESISRLPRGIYIATLTYTNGKMSTRKIGL